MTIHIILKGWYQRKSWDGETERWVEVPEGTTCDEALKTKDIDYKAILNSALLLLIRKES